MKINELKVIEEGFFSDLGDVVAPDRYAERDPKKTQAGVQKLFLKDFIKDFYADLEDNVNAGVIGKKITAVNPRKTTAATSTTTPAQTGANQSSLSTSQYAPAGQTGTQYNPNVQTSINEYAVFNTLLEYILNEQSTTPAQAQQPSAQKKTRKQKVPLNDWIVRWFNAYMQGVEWKQELPTVKKIAQDIAKSYDKDKKSAQAQIENLATTAWEITTKNKGSPRGFGNISSASTNQKNNITSQEISKDSYKTQDFVKNLTPDERDNLKKAIEKAPK